MYATLITGILDGLSLYSPHFYMSLLVQISKAILFYQEHPEHGFKLPVRHGIKRWQDLGDHDTEVQ